MPFTIRRIDPQCNFISQFSWDIFAATIPVTAIDAALTQTATHEQRQRRLSMRAVLVLIIAMNIWTHCAIPMVFRQMVRGLRWLWPDDDLRLPQSNAFTYRRYRLGVKPLAWLFHQCCQPLATTATPGAFLFGLRLMAIDGTVENVPDTPANARSFGRPRGSRGEGAFPQARAVYLVECGTHAIVDAGIWPVATHERVGGRRMLRSVGPGMLVLWDRGLHSYGMLAEAQTRGAHVLTRLSRVSNPTVIAILPDGTELVHIVPHTADHYAAMGPIVARRIRYQLSMPTLGDPTEVHTLLTTLLDPAEAPARALVCAYHERWEIELTIDELDTHQRVVYRPFRSQKPVGVIQEFYGALLAHYAIRAVMHDAAVEAQLDPDRISFVSAVAEIQAAVREFQQTDPCDHLRLYRRLLAECRRTLLPPRRLRSYPRVVKQKMSKFLRKSPDDAGWCQATGRFVTAVCVIGPDGQAMRSQADYPVIQWTVVP